MEEDEWTESCLRCLFVEQILTKFAVSHRAALTGTVEQN